MRYFKTMFLLSFLWGAPLFSQKPASYPTGFEWLEWDYKNSEESAFFIELIEHQKTDDLFDIYIMSKLTEKYSTESFSSMGLRSLKRLYFSTPFFSKKMRPNPEILLQTVKKPRGGYLFSGVYGEQVGFLKTLFRQDKGATESFEDVIAGIYVGLNAFQNEVDILDWIYFFTEVFSLESFEEFDGISQMFLDTKIKFSLSPLKLKRMLKHLKGSAEESCKIVQRYFKRDWGTFPVERLSFYLRRYEKAFPECLRKMPMAFRVQRYEDFRSYASKSSLVPGIVGKLSQVVSVLFSDSEMSEFLAEKVRIDREQIIRTQWESFKASPTMMIKKQMGLSKDLRYLVFSNDSEDEPGFKEVVTRFSREFPDLLSPDAVQVLWDRVQNTLVGVSLLEAYFRHSNEFLPKKLPMDSLQMIADVTSLNDEALRILMSKKNDFTTFYFAVLDIQLLSPFPLLRRVEFDEEVLVNRQLRSKFFDALLLMRDAILSYYAGQNRLGIEHAYKLWDILQSRTITAEFVQEFNSIALQYRVDRFNSVMNSSGSSEQLTISLEQMNTLLARWGNIDPLYTFLVNTYTNTKQYKNTTSVLKTIKAVVEDDFEKFKFEESDYQLEGMSEEQKLQWRKRHAVATVYSKDKKIEKEDFARSDLLASYQKQKERLVKLMHDAFQDHCEADSRFSVTDKNLLLVYLESKIHRVSPLQAIDALKAELEIEEDKKMACLVMGSVAVTSSRQMITGSLKFFSSYLRRGLWSDMFPGFELKTPMESLKTSLKELERSSVDLVEGILFTTNNWDARALITIGDFVDVFSCMNYRTAKENIRFLNGYVRDANTQALFSFYIKQDDFSYKEEFETVSYAIASGEVEKNDMSYNGNTGKVEFNIGTSIIQTKPLYHGVGRRLFRIGKDTNGDFGISAVNSKDYQQIPSKLKNAYYHQEKLVLQAIREAVDAKSKEKITVAKSINPSGTYVDGGDGGTPSAFKLEPNFFL